MDPVPTFWCEPNGLARVSLRVHSDIACPAADQPPDTRYETHCRATVVLFDTAPVERDPDGYYPSIPAERYADASWPTLCATCGLARDWTPHVDQDPWYRSEGRGQWTDRELPVGAMWDAWWLPDRWKGTDGIGLSIMVPDGSGGAHQFLPDAEASNCTRKGEDHKCWCRHGDPRTGPVTIDKTCDTCAAGAGSILVHGDPGWHGYVRNGMIVE